MIGKEFFEMQRFTASEREGKEFGHHHDKGNDD